LFSASYPDSTPSISSNKASISDVLVPFGFVLQEQHVEAKMPEELKISSANPSKSRKR
jgi:hypothetical protein